MKKVLAVVAFAASVTFVSAESTSFLEDSVQSTPKVESPQMSYTPWSMIGQIGQAIADAVSPRPKKSKNQSTLATPVDSCACDLERQAILSLQNDLYAFEDVVNSTFNSTNKEMTALQAAFNLTQSRLAVQQFQLGVVQTSQTSMQTALTTTQNKIKDLQNSLGSGASHQEELDAINVALDIAQRKLSGMQSQLDYTQQTLQASIDALPDMAFVQAADALLEAQIADRALKSDVQAADDAIKAEFDKFALAADVQEKDVALNSRIQLCALKADVDAEKEAINAAIALRALKSDVKAADDALQAAIATRALPADITAATADLSAAIALRALASDVKTADDSIKASIASTQSSLTTLTNEVRDSTKGLSATYNAVQALSPQVASANTSIANLNNMQVVSDYMSTNAATFAITNVGKSFAKFCAKSGNTVDFQMLLTSDAIDIITINLKKNNVNVATAIINADTRFRTIVWREKLTANATYEVWFTRTAVGSTTVAVNNFQWEFRTYGPNYVAQIAQAANQDAQVGGTQCF